MHGHRHNAAAPGSRASARTGSTAGETVFGRILAGKKPQWTGRLGQPHTFHYLPDIARGLVVLADRREADGQVWHLPAAPPLTAQRFFDMLAEAADQPVPVYASVASPALLAASEDNGLAASATSPGLARSMQMRTSSRVRHRMSMRRTAH